MGEGENSKAILVGSNGEMEESDGWQKIPDFYTTAGDIQAKPTPVSGGLCFLVIIIIIIYYENRARSTQLKHTQIHKPT